MRGFLQNLQECVDNPEGCDYQHIPEGCDYQHIPDGFSENPAVGVVQLIYTMVMDCVLPLLCAFQLKIGLATSPIAWLLSRQRNRAVSLKWNHRVPSISTTKETLTSRDE